MNCIELQCEPCTRIQVRNNESGCTFRYKLECAVRHACHDVVIKVQFDKVPRCETICPPPMAVQRRHIHSAATQWQLCCRFGMGQTCHRRTDRSQFGLCCNPSVCYIPITQKRCILGSWLLQNTNRKPGLNAAKTATKLSTAPLQNYWPGGCTIELEIARNNLVQMRKILYPVTVRELWPWPLNLTQRRSEAVDGPSVWVKILCHFRHRLRVPDLRSH